MPSPARSPRISPAAWIAIASFACLAVIWAATRDAAPRDTIAIAAEPSEPATLAVESRRVSIEMYSAAWCAACGRAKVWMRDQGIAFHEVDVEQRAGAMGQLRMLNPRATLPTFDIEGRVVVGFEEQRLASAIEEQARTHDHR